MGQRRTQLIGALFLILTVCSGLLVLNYQQYQVEAKENFQALLGQLVDTGNYSEAQVVELLNQPLNEEKLAIGEQLVEKYAISSSLNPQQKIMQKYGVRGLLIIGTLVILVIGLLGLEAHRKKINEKKLLLENEQLIAEKSIIDVQLQRKTLEEVAIKTSITDIAHQLKTPVASLKLSMEIALGENYSLVEKNEFKEQAEIQVQKLDLMLDGLVKISQLEADLIRLQPQIYSLKQIMQEVINSLIVKALEKEIEIELIQTAELSVLIDRKWTKEALGNVLENAIKYSPANSAIRIQVTPLVTYALIEIIDEGPGISKEEINLIYQRFTRGQAAILQDIEGSGVGLYLSRKIIEEQGGVIKVVNQKPQGSNFQITLPLVK